MTPQIRSCCLFFIGLCLLPASASAWTMEDARRIAEDYAAELKMKANLLGSPAAEKPWAVATDVTLAGLSYKESDSGLKSSFKALYTEFSAELSRRLPYGFITSARGSFGLTTNEPETWKIDNITVQTNDLDLWQVSADSKLAYALTFERANGLRLLPSVGYGFRYVKFTRSNFNIPDIITIRDTVSERYAIHHLDVGLGIDYALGERWRLVSDTSAGFVVYNQADNSVLGTVTGNGGLLIRSRLGLEWALHDSWNVTVEGYSEFQDLEGGRKGNVIWPDNTLAVYGGSLRAKFSF